MKNSELCVLCQDEKVPDMTGREAVEYFAKLHHLGKIQSIYFNIVESRHFRPYELRSCPKNKVSGKYFCNKLF